MVLTLADLPCPPLFGTDRSPERPTLGAAVGATARRLGKPLHAWQQLIADVALEIDPETGLLAYDEVIVICMRQQGKSELLLPVMAHRCSGFDSALSDWVRRELGHQVPAPGPQSVLYLAQTAEDARKKWRDVHLPRILAAKEIRRHMLKPSAPHGGARLRSQNERMFWRNGSGWSPGTTTGKGSGTGDTLDLAMVDEAWAQPDSRTELGLRPAMLTRDYRQLWVCSMIPGLSRAAPGTWKYLASKRAAGRARVSAGSRKGTAFFDFSAPPEADPSDPTTWWGCMPSVGLTVPESAVKTDFEKFDLPDFEAEYLSIAPTVASRKWALIDEATWRGLYDPDSIVAGKSALGVSFSEDRTQAWICEAGRRDDGDWHVEVLEPGLEVPVTAVGVDWVLPRLVDMVKARRKVKGGQVVTVCIDPSRPAVSLLQPLKNRGIDTTRPNGPDVAGVTGMFFDATGQESPDPVEAAVEALVDGVAASPVDRLHHIGQPELDRAIAAATKLDQGNGRFVLVKKGSGAELGPVEGVILAMHGFVVKGPVSRPKSNIF